MRFNTFPSVVVAFLHLPEAADTDAGAAPAAQPAAEEIPTERDNLQFRKTPGRGRHSQASLIWVGTFIKRNKKNKGSCEHLTGH